MCFRECWAVERLLVKLHDFKMVAPPLGMVASNHHSRLCTATVGLPLRCTLSVIQLRGAKAAALLFLTVQATFSPGLMMMWMMMWLAVQQGHRCALTAL
jgi:hypothetical protein